MKRPSFVHVPEGALPQLARALEGALRRFPRTLSWVWLVVMLWPRAGVADSPSPLLVVEVSEADDLAARRLLALTEQSAQLVRMPEASEPARVLSLARSVGAQHVVIFDGAQQRVVVLRTVDGAQWLRPTDESDATPFVAAFVAVELLSLSARAVVVPVPVVPRLPVAPSGRTTSLGLRLGIDALATPPYAGSVRPSLGALATFGRRGSPWALLLELHAGPHARRTQPLGDGRLQLTRSDLTARVGALWQREHWGISSFVEAGVLLIDAAFRGLTPSDQTRQAFGAGLGAEPNVQLSRWLRLYLSAIAQTASPRGDYRVAGQSALREPRFGVQLGAGLWLTLPIR